MNSAPEERPKLITFVEDRRVRNVNSRTESVDEIEAPCATTTNQSLTGFAAKSRSHAQTRSRKRRGTRFPAAGG